VTHSKTRHRAAMVAVAAALVSAAALLLVTRHGAVARSAKSFDEIHQQVKGRTTAEVIGLLGEPDSRQPVFGADEKWIWWNYTFLTGDDYPPEIRGRVVHLEIVFGNADSGGEGERRVDGGLAVNYRMPTHAD